MLGYDNPPFWQRSDLVHNTLASACLTPEFTRDNGMYRMRAGSQKALSRSTKAIFNSVEDACKFPENRGWRQQLPLLECLVEQFYRGGDSTFGYVEITKERRKATARMVPGTGTTLVQPSSKPIYLASERELRLSTVDIGGVCRVPGRLLRFAYREGESKRKTDFTELIVPRTLQSGWVKVWSEYWYSLARRDDDDALLRGGVIPGQVWHNRENGALRTTPMLSLCRFTPGRFWAHTILEYLCIELHPGTGMLMDLRGIPQELESVLLTSPRSHELLLTISNKSD